MQVFFIDPPVEPEDDILAGLFRQQIIQMFYELGWFFYFHAGNHEGLGKENF